MFNSMEFMVWRALQERSLASRLDPVEFSTYATLLYQRNPLSPALICSLFLSPALQNNYCLDPRASRYVTCLLNLGYIDVPNILKSLWQCSTCRVISNGNSLEEDQSKWINSFTAEETIFYRLVKGISTGSIPTMVKEAGETISACTLWMEGIISVTRSQNEMPTLSASQMADLNAQIIALGTLIVSVVESAIVQTAIAKGYLNIRLRKRFREALAGIIPLMVLQNISQGAARLEVFRTETLATIEPTQKKFKQSIDKEIEDIIGEDLEDVMAVENMIISELPETNTRAGLYVFLNSLLVGRPLIDDNSILTFLHNRYRGDIQSSIIDLILASFDTLANATIRNEKGQTKNLMKSFLINKLPLLLSTLCSQLFPPLTSEYCITEALNQVDTTNFPTLSTMFDEANNVNLFPDSVRQDFCFACCLHGLIAESSIEGLLGDVPIQSLPAEGKYIKRNLVQECLSDVERAKKMVDELEKMDGNVGAVSTAIIEVISKLCENRETMALKEICSRLVRKPSSLDVLLLFEKPITILQPICDLLDNWRSDEDQGESQPVYEEFGSILLLLLSFVNRYSLTPASLGVRQTESFVLRLLQAPYTSLAQTLPPKTLSHLNSWLLSLFSPENSGLTDDLMSSCPPQEFYLLIPALFHNILLAYVSKSITPSVLSSGLEYLVDTFLLPSLVPGISFLSAYIWEDHGDKDAVIQILNALIIKPRSNKINIDKDAAQILEVVLNITAKDLEQSLRWLQRVEPQRRDIEPLSKALWRSLGWERSASCDHTEIENWTSSPGGGLSIAVKQTLTNLLQWHLQPSDNPANYTHRQILLAVKMLGAKRLIHIILDEYKSGVDAGHAGAALDVASAIVCAVDAATWDSTFCSVGVENVNDGEIVTPQRRLNLREALKMEVEDAPKLQKTDPFFAEIIVRLYRKVETLLTENCVGTTNVLSAAAELDAVVNMAALTQSDGDSMSRTISDLKGINRMEGISDLEISHLSRFDELVDGMGNVDEFNSESVSLLTEDSFMGMGDNNGDSLLDGMNF